MMVLVSYDLSTETLEGTRIIRNVSKACENYGQRVQNSVFECLVDPSQWVTLKNQLELIFDPEKDSLRYYYLGKNWKNRVEHQGSKPGYDPEGSLVV